MRVYVDTLDQIALQSVLDAECGPNTFTVGLHKNDDGTRLVYFEHADDLSPDLIAQATSLARQQDVLYLTTTKAHLLDRISRVAAKSRLRKPLCSYTQDDSLQATAWLTDNTLPCPVAVQTRAFIHNVTHTQAANQIVLIYESWVAYDDQVAQLLIQAQTSIMAQSTVMTTKLVYEDSCQKFAVLENTDYGDSTAN